MAIISVIVPFWNACSTIERCVRSIFEQTYEDLEFIFIDDASTDESISIIKRTIKDYPKRESQVHVIQNLCNRGITESRKLGLFHASGQYIAWVDADDWVEEDMMEKLFSASDNGEKDIVVCDYYKEYGPESVPFHHDSLFKPSDCLEHLNNLHKMPHSLWSQIIRRSLFPNEIVTSLRPSNWGEDLFMIISAYCTAQSIAQVRDCLYHYNRTNVNALSRTQSISKNDWKLQQENVETISHLLFSSIKAKAKIGISHLKFVTKNRYRSCFDNDKEFFFQWRDSHRHILSFDDMPFFVRIKLAIVFSSYFAYSLYHHAHHA